MLSLALTPFTFSYPKILILVFMFDWISIAVQRNKNCCWNNVSKGSSGPIIVFSCFNCIKFSLFRDFFMNVLWVLIRNQLDRIFFQQSQVGTLSNLYDGAFLWKQGKLGFLDRIFPHLDRIRRVTPYLSELSPNAGKYGPEKLRIRTFCLTRSRIRLGKWANPLTDYNK